MFRLIWIKDYQSDFEINAYEVDHSIFGATGYLLCGDTTIAYTGDFRLHGKKGKKSENFINQAKNASVLVIEGTRAAKEDISEIQTAVSPLIETDSSDIESTSSEESISTQSIDVTENESAVLKALTNSRFTLRSIYGISKEINKTREEVTQALSSLIGKRWAAEVQGKKGARWAITVDGRRVSVSAHCNVLADGHKTAPV